MRRRLRHAAKCKDIAKKLEVVVAGTGVLKNVVGMRKRMETALAAAKARHGPCRKQAMALYAKMSAAAGKYSDTLQNDMDEINRGKIDRAEGAFQVVEGPVRAMLALGLCSEARRSAMRLGASPQNSECSVGFPSWRL